MRVFQRTGWKQEYVGYAGFLRTRIPDQHDLRVPLRETRRGMRRVLRFHRVPTSVGTGWTIRSPGQTASSRRCRRPARSCRQDRRRRFGLTRAASPAGSRDASQTTVPANKQWPLLRQYFDVVVIEVPAAGHEIQRFLQPPSSSPTRSPEPPVRSRPARRQDGPPSRPPVRDPRHHINEVTVQRFQL